MPLCSKFHLPSLTAAKYSDLLQFKWQIDSEMATIVKWTILNSTNGRVVMGRHLAPDAENQLAFSADNRLALDAFLLTSTT